MKQNIIGAGGGGKAGGGGRQAQEDADSLRSKQFATVVDVISEGEIEGLVDGLKSVYLNNTPLQNSNGTFNFKAVESYISHGGATLPTYAGMPGYFRSGGVKATTSVNTKVSFGTPVTRSITNPEVDWAEITVGIPALSVQDMSTGDIRGTKVEFAIQMQNNGGGFLNQPIATRWIPVTDLSGGIYLSGDASALSVRVLQVTDTSGYDYSVQYRKLGTTPWINMPEKYRSGNELTPEVGFEIEGLEQSQYQVRLNNIGGQAIDILSVSSYSVVAFDTIEGKCTTRYQRTYKIALPGSGPWDLRVIRQTEDAPNSATRNDTYWDLMTECVDVKLSYPNTAAVLLTLDAEHFSSIPTRGYDIRGLRVLVPVNYNPLTRAYSGTWNGTFKLAWTDNPAWCFYDMVTNKRYGLGEYLDVAQADKWALYQIGRYCDEIVPDGFGGTEPRFTCNLFLQTREAAFKVINSMANIFRGMAYWAGGQIVPSQDSPSDPVALFTAANVIDGLFTYQGADRRARHTVVLVSWNDPADLYRQKIEYIQDEAAVRRWGVVETEILAVGCTSRGQAHRLGKWLLYTEQNESETIVFSAGMDAALCAPGEIIKVQDSSRAGVRMGGRLAAGTTVSQLMLDAPMTITVGNSYEVSVMLPTGLIETRSIGNGPGTTSTINLITPLSSVPVEGAMWVISASNLAPELWRVLGTVETDPNTVSITAIYHDPGKYDFVEQDIVLEYIPTSAIPTRPGQVINPRSASQLFSLNDGASSVRISVNWTAPETAASYVIAWRRESENYKSAETTTPSFEIDNVAAGTFQIRITARNSLGVSGETVSMVHVVEASGTSPDVLNLRLNPTFLGRDLNVAWDAVPGASQYEVEIRNSTTDALLRTEPVFGTEYSYVFGKNVQDGGPRRSIKVRVRAKTLIGVSANWTVGTFSNPSPATPAGVSGEAGPGQASVIATRPTDEDLQGMIVWMYTDASVPEIDGNIIYKGSDNAFTKVDLDPGIPMFFKLAFYDSFGVTGLNVSSSISITPTATGGVTKVTALPANPAALGGELALFLDVADLAQRGLYGWSGTAWENTNEILNGSVTSSKLAAGAVGYTQLAAAAVRASNLSVKKHFLY
jgi:predicted phage tail protein